MEGVAPAPWYQAGETADFWRALISPDTSILLDAGRDMIVTIFMAVLATLFAVVVAVPLSFLAARNLMTGPVGGPSTRSSAGR